MIHLVLRLGIFDSPASPHWGSLAHSVKLPPFAVPWLGPPWVRRAAGGVDPTFPVWSCEPRDQRWGQGLPNKNVFFRLDLEMFGIYYPLPKNRFCKIFRTTGRVNLKSFSSALQNSKWNIPHTLTNFCIRVRVVRVCFNWAVIKNPCDIPLYWLVNRDPYNGLS